MKKGISKVISVFGYVFGAIGIIASLWAGISMLSTVSAIGYYSSSAKTALILTGLGIMLIGSFISIFVPALILGFAELIRSTQSIEKHLKGEATPAQPVPPTPTPNKVNQSNSWFCPSCGKSNIKSEPVCVWCKVGHRD